MNIIVKPYGSELCYCRPDTTWEKESRDLYIPEGVNKILWAPVVFARVSKAGKCVSPKFITRYYDAVGFGILAYSDDKDIAYSSCIDHTSILPLPLFNPVIFENEENTFNFKIGEKSAAITISADIKENLEKAICKASARVSLRIGDMVALELAPPETAINRTDDEVHLKGEFCENSLFDFKMIF